MARTASAPAYISAALAYGWHDFTSDRTLMVRRHVDMLLAELRANCFWRAHRGRLSLRRASSPASRPTRRCRCRASRRRPTASSATSALRFCVDLHLAQPRPTTRSELGAWLDTCFAVQRQHAVTLRGRARLGARFRQRARYRRRRSRRCRARASRCCGACGADRYGAGLSRRGTAASRNGLSLGAKFDGEFAFTRADLQRLGLRALRLVGERSARVTRQLRARSVSG